MEGLRAGSMGPEGDKSLSIPTPTTEQSILERSSQADSSDYAELSGRMLGLVSKIQEHWCHPRGYSIMSPKAEGLREGILMKKSEVR